jgi:hypothetical protein
MLACRLFNRWPFPNQPETMTQAQLLFYDEALRQSQADDKPAGPKLPKRLTKEDMQRIIAR